jgi:hypothetical protein
MVVKTVKVVGLTQLEKKLDEKLLVQPEVEAARDTIVTRLMRGGKGLGVTKNSLTKDVKPLGATVTSTLNYPRTRGTAWGKKNEVIVKGMSTRVVKKMVQRIEERWAAEAGGND